MTVQAQMTNYSNTYGLKQREKVLKLLFVY